MSLYKHCASPQVIGPFGRTINTVACNTLQAASDVQAGDYIKAVYGASCWHVTYVHHSPHFSIVKAVLVEAYTDDRIGMSDTFAIRDTLPMQYLRPVKEVSEKVLDTQSCNL